METYKICKDCSDKQVHDLILKINKTIENFESFKPLYGIDLEITIKALKNCLKTYEGFLKQYIKGGD